jgi:hypothetical protein
MSLSSTDKCLLTPSNCAVIFIDHQPQMLFGVANIDRQDLLNNMLVLSMAASWPANSRGMTRPDPYQAEGD